MVLRRFPSFAATAAVCGLTWIACSNRPHNSMAVPVDASDDGSSDDGSGIDFDSGTCSPCGQICACEPGDSFYSPAACGTYTCPSDGIWGGVDWCQGDGCPEAAPPEDVVLKDVGCSPCFDPCPCTPGTTFVDEGSCTLFTCPSSGTFGPFKGCGGIGCVDGEVPTPPDASSDAATDAASDSPAE
ncbi:MAG TPA: hypothetical protein VGG39_01485 [Polyangiaceae bacterium]|jgi:hypothetical protein